MMKWISNFVNGFEINKLKEENKRLHNIINRLETERGRIIAQNNQQLSNMQTNLSNSKSFLEKMTDNFV